MVLEATITETVIEENIRQFLLVLSVSLSVATLPRIFSWFRHIPYTLLLVIVGLVLATVDVRLINLSPELILFIFLPPLLFEAAWNLRWTELQKYFLPISLYAILGVLISIGGVTIGLTQFTGMSLTTALLVGASLSATDPISVTALFRELGVEKRLSTVMEGESLFNDGMAVVSFSFIATFALGTGIINLPTIGASFFTVVGIGIGIGGLIGFGISYLTQRFDLPLVEQSLTLVSAYGTYLIAEDLGGSGVIATVTTGLILGNFGSRIGMNPRTRIIVTEFWEFLAFFVNSIVFLLIGDQIHFSILANTLDTIAVTIAAMIFTRAISIYGCGFLSNFLTESKITLPEKTVLWWGGLRGSVSIALALSVPAILPDREEIIATVFGVVLFTLLVQGLTIKPLLKKLNLLGEQPLRQSYLEIVARQVALNRVLHYLNDTDRRPGSDLEFYRYQQSLIQEELENLQIQVEQLQNEYPNLRSFINEQLLAELAAIEADTYAEFVRSGRLNKELSPWLNEVIEN